MWQITTTDIPALGNYAEALRVYEKTAPLRGSADKNIKPLGHRRAMHKSFRKLKDGSIACKLYHTDVVVFHPDNTITLDPWDSKSTNAFANQLLPTGISVNFPCVVLYQQGERWVYQLSEAATLKQVESGDWEITTPDAIKPWKCYNIDRTKASAALRETRYNEFVAWAQVREQLGVTDSKNCVGDLIAALQAGPERWREVYGHNIDYLRKLIYQRYDCIQVTLRPWIYVSEWSNVLKLQRRWE